MSLMTCVLQSLAMIEYPYRPGVLLMEIEWQSCHEEVMVFLSWLQIEGRNKKLHTPPQRWWYASAAEVLLADIVVLKENIHFE